MPASVISIIGYLIFFLWAGVMTYRYLQSRKKPTGPNAGSYTPQRKEIQEINAGAVIIPDGSKRTSVYFEQYTQGNQFLHEQRYEEAIRIFKRLSEIPEETETALIGLGTSYSLKGEAEQARDCFNRALELNDKNYNALLGMAGYYFKAKEYSTAEAYYRKACTLMPELPDAYWGLACAYHMMNEKEQASDNAKIFVRMVPDSRYRPQLEQMIIPD